MKLKYLLVILSVMMATGCSVIHRTTDLNKIRFEHNNAQHQQKIKSITDGRQRSISTDDITIYANGIRCLSEPFIIGMKDLNAKNRNNRQKEKDGQNDEIIRLQENIERITRTGGFVEERLNHITGEIYTGKTFTKTINQYALEIADLDYQIAFLNKTAKNDADFRKIRNLANKKHSLEFELEELKSYLDSTQKDLMQAQSTKELTAQAIKQIDDTISGGNDVYKVAVGNIYDKTGKIFPASSTAISEMVAHALSYNYGIKLIDIPFGSDWSETRYNPLLGTNSTNLSQNPSLLSSHSGVSGIVFPSDMYISGALVQYDDLPITKPFGTQITLNIDPLDISTGTKTITVGMILRAASSDSALLLDDGDIEKGRGGDRASVYVKNTYFVKNIGANVFEIKSKRLYGGRVSVEVSDPANYVIREMVEAGVYEILKKSLRPNEMSNQQKQVCDNIIFNATV